MRCRNGNYPKGDRWYQIHGHETRCYRCDVPGEKKDFMILAYRVPKYSSYRVFARLCWDCFAELAEEFDVPLPEDV